LPFTLRKRGLQGVNLLIHPAPASPGLGRALLIALSFYSIGSFFLLFSVYLQHALHVSALDAGLVFLPFGAGFLLGPLTTPYFRRRLGEWVNPIGMGLETAGFLGLAWLISATPDGTAPASTPRGARVLRHDRRHRQLDPAGEHRAQRGPDRRDLLHGPRRTGRPGGDLARLHRRRSVHRLLPRRRRGAGHDARPPRRRWYALFCKKAR
jgi:hypothetical protein